MSTVIFKSYHREVNLDQKGEEILTEALDELITQCLSDYRWRVNNAEFLANLHGTAEHGVINQNEKKCSRTIKNRAGKKEVTSKVEVKP